MSGNEEQDFNENSSSAVAEFTVAKWLIFLSYQRGWHVRQSNFDNAFTNGMLQRLVYIKLPRHSYDKKVRKSSVFKLWTSPYGLKNAAKTWNKSLFCKISKGGFERNAKRTVHISDEELYRGLLDDLAVFGKALNVIDDFIDQMRLKFKIKDLRRPAQFLGLELNWLEDQTVRLKQSTLIKNLIEENGM